MARSATHNTVWAALLGNLLVAITKLVAALLSGSSAMLSEAFHSIVDTGNEALLLHGMRRSRRAPDVEHPYGYGRELYFWSFIVALLIFALGAGVSFYEGIAHIMAPVQIKDPLVNYIVLGISFVFEGATFWIALTEFNKVRGTLGYFEAVTRSKDPPSFLVLFEDSAALIGIVIAFVGTLAADKLAMPVLDGVASIGIGILLAVTAMYLARESKGLLIGEGARGHTMRSIRKIAAEQPGVEQVNDLVTVHLAPDQVVAALSLEFKDPLTTPEIENAVAAIESRICKLHPEVVSIFVKPQSSSTRDQRVQSIRPA
jgi:cation diffusion facilitator family transporter